MKSFIVNHKVIIYITFAVLFDFIFLSNILKSDYFGDDLYNFQANGTILFDYSSVSTFVLEHAIGWMKSGRFFPISFYSFFVFDWFSSLIAYKSFIISLIGLNIVLFSYLIVKLTKNSFFYVLIILIPILFQYRYYHDPILAFHGLMATLWIFIILALIFFDKYLKSRNKIYLFLSVFFYTLSLLTYEITYVFILFFPFVVWINDKENISTGYSKLKSLKSLMPFILVLFIIVSISIYLRIIHPISTGPYAPVWDFWLILKTFLFQSLSVLPTSYFFIFEDFNNFQMLIKQYHILIGLFFLILLIVIFFDKSSLKTYSIKNMILFSITIMIIPAVLISLSPKFHDTVGNINSVLFGRPYLPIYIQTFGLALLITVFLENIKNKFLFFIVALILFFILIVHSISNDSVIEKVNTPFKANRELLTHFLNNDFIQVIKDEQIIRLENSEIPFHSQAFFRMITKKKINVVFEPNTKFDFALSYEITNDLGYVYIKNQNNELLNVYIYKIKDNYKKVNMNEKTNTLPMNFENFYPWEGAFGSFRWAKGNSNIQIYNSTNKMIVAEFCFQLGSLADRDLTISYDGKLVSSLSIKSNSKIQNCNIVNILPKTSIFSFHTSVPADLPGNGDMRKLSFSLENFRYTLR